MKKVIVANHNKTLIPDPFDVDIADQEYRKRWPSEYEAHKGKPWLPEARAHLKELEESGVYVEKPFTGVAEFLFGLRDTGIGFALFAGAPPEKLKDKYTAYGLGPLDGFYGTKEERFSVEGERDNPESFRKLQQIMEAGGLEPVAYVSNNRNHAQVAADLWGHGFVFDAGSVERTEGGLYIISDWIQMTAQKAANFLGVR